MPFSTLGLSAPLLRAISERHYRAPTPIQAAAIPVVLRGGDLRASAQTGSGKTAAFALPILQQLLQGRGDTRWRGAALIIVPTRELAMQIAESFQVYARYIPGPVKVIAVFGGVSINPQMIALRGADVIVATPGRLLDLAERNALQLEMISILVLDEADKLFEFGFAEELTRIWAMLPARRQTLLFSATFPPALQTLGDLLLHDPTRIEVESAPIHEPAIEQRAIAIDAARRTQLLRHFIQQNTWSRVLVFVGTKYATEHVAEKLRCAGVNAAPFHGKLSQGARTQTLTDFKRSKLQVLVATDVAARGIDIAELPVVVNYDLPRSAIDYLHRIGRTGRAGMRGVAVSFVSADSEAHFRLIEKRSHMSLPREQIGGFEPQDVAQPPALAAPGTAGIKGKRRSKKDKLREAGEPALPDKK